MYVGLGTHPYATDRDCLYQGKDKLVDPSRARLAITNLKLA